MTFIYFIQATPSGPIKIGTTTGNPHRRMKIIQTGCPWPVKMLGAIYGSHAQERLIHRTLSYFRTQGEWFEPHPKVLAAVEAALTFGRCVGPPQKMRFPNGVSKVITSLGGPNAVAKLVGLKQPAVSNWKKRGSFPPRTYIALQAALAERRLTAPNSLWGMPDSGEA